MKRIFFLLTAAFGFILGLLESKPGRKRGRITVDFTVFQTDQIKIIGEFTRMELKEGQKVDIEVRPKTARGNVAAIESGSARFVSSDESVVSVTQDPNNELKAVVRGLDGSANESVVVEFRADADRSENVREIVGTLAVTCTQGDASVIEIEAGTATDDTGESENGSGATETDAGETGEGSDQSGPGSDEAPGDSTNDPPPIEGENNGDDVPATDTTSETEGLPNEGDSPATDSGEGDTFETSPTVEGSTNISTGSGNPGGDPITTNPPVPPQPIDETKHDQPPTDAGALPEPISPDAEDPADADDARGNDPGVPGPF